MCAGTDPAQGHLQQSRHMQINPMPARKGDGDINYAEYAAL